jgi:ankyrin repeat protein
MILEKLGDDDDDHYAALHYAVLSNKSSLCKKLIEKYKCSNNLLKLIVIVFNFIKLFQDVNLIGQYGQTPLHLATLYSISTEQNANKDSDSSQNTNEDSDSSQNTNEDSDSSQNPHKVN